METEGIGLERSNRRRLPVVPLSYTAVTVTVVLAGLLAPEKGRRAAGTRRIFPLRLGEQAIGLAGHPGEPDHIFLGVVPAHEDDRSRAAAPTDVAGSAPLRTAAGRNARVPIGECHGELGHGDRVGQDYPVLRTFIDVGAILRLRGSHFEPP